MKPHTLIVALLVAACSPLFAAVEWRALDPAAFNEARRREVPLYVLVVHPASEASRDTLSQTLAVPETAAFAQQRFVCVLVDANRAPADAALARESADVLRQAVGWPIHLWLTPEGQPLEVAVNLPATEEWGRKSVAQTLQRIDDEWRQDVAAARARAAQAHAELVAARAVRHPHAGPLDDRLRDSAAEWAARYDGRAGFGGVVAQPEPEVIRLLVAFEVTREVGLKALRATVESGLHDATAGGFFRSCEDPEWRTPYRQKLLSDQLRLAEALLDAAAVDANPLWPQRARSALDYVLAQLARPDGALRAGEQAEPLPPLALAPAGEHGRAVAVFARAAQELREPRYRAATALTADFIEQRLAGRRFPDGGAPSASDLAGVVRGLRAAGRDVATPFAQLEKHLEPTTHRILAVPGVTTSALPEPLAVEAVALDAAPKNNTFRDAALAAPLTPETALALRRASR